MRFTAQAMRLRISDMIYPVHTCLCVRTVHHRMHTYFCMHHRMHHGKVKHTCSFFCYAALYIATLCHSGSTDVTSGLARGEKLCSIVSTSCATLCLRCILTTLPPAITLVAFQHLSETHAFHSAGYAALSLWNVQCSTDCAMSNSSREATWQAQCIHSDSSSHM